MTDSETVDDPHAELERLRRRLVEVEHEAAALRTSEAELRAMFRAMVDAVLVVDGDGRYLRLPETAPGATYKPPPHFLGRRMHEVLPAELADPFVATIRRALAQQCMVSLTYSRTIAGQELWFSANACPMSTEAVVVVVRDITTERRHEQVLRDSLRQQELLREQEAALLQLSTPLIPISEDVVVMPLVGRLDAGRIAQALETLLRGVEGARARVAILDITGVGAVDDETAVGLVRAARAVQLLGARVVLTGIRPEVAARLASLAADLSGIATRGTLQDGVREARIGERRPQC